MRTIVEDLNYAMKEPNVVASQQAQKLGLSHVGFGRYQNPKTNQVSHIVQNGKLVPINKAVKTNEYKTQQSDDMGNLSSSLSPEVQEVNQILTQAYPPNNYDTDEINAIAQFASQSYSDINDMLSGLPSGITANQVQPMGPDDMNPALIALLDSAMKKSRSPIDFITYTKLGGDVAQMDLIPGTQFKFKGFRNTTINLQNILTSDDDSDVVLQIRVRKNSRGIYAANYSQNPDDLEFILPRGCKIEIISGPTKLVGSDAQNNGQYTQISYYDCISKS